MGGAVLLLPSEPSSLLLKALYGPSNSPKATFSFTTFSPLSLRAYCGAAATLAAYWCGAEKVIHRYHREDPGGQPPHGRTDGYAGSLRHPKCTLTCNTHKPQIKCYISAVNIPTGSIWNISFFIIPSLDSATSSCRPETRRLSIFCITSAPQVPDGIRQMFRHTDEVEPRKTRVTRSVGKNNSCTGAGGVLNLTVCFSLAVGLLFCFCFFWCSS